MEEKLHENEEKLDFFVKKICVFFKVFVQFINITNDIS